MKKLTLFAAVLGMAVATQAGGLKGLGYDNDLKHIVARIGLNDNAVIDVGGALKLDNRDDGNDDNNLALGISAFYLGKLQHWNMVDNYFSAGLIFTKIDRKDKNIGIRVFGGLQPEVTLLERIVVSTRFGLDIPISPEDQGLMINTVGSPISIVAGSSFKILW